LKSGKNQYIAHLNLRSGWDADEKDKVELIYSLIQLGYVLVRNNVNRYKAFIFYQPGVYSRLTATELTGPQKVRFACNTLTLFRWLY
jgi:hypothetical protein